MCLLLYVLLWETLLHELTKGLYCMERQEIYDCLSVSARLYSPYWNMESLVKLAVDSHSLPIVVTFL